MNITVNGNKEDLHAGVTVANLLVSKMIAADHVVVERNGEIVGKGNYATTVLAAGDKLEVVHFVGGG